MTKSTYSGYIRTPHYYETDQMGIVHHSNYIRWFEEARVQLLDYLDCSYKEIEEAGIIIPVLDVSCQYKGMIHFGDTIRIDISIHSYTGTRLTFDYTIYPAEGTTILTTGTSSHCFLSAETKRLIRLKKTHPEIHQIFEDYYEQTAN
ncbi:acyl-CoA thioester hydrolase [Enterococcus sp. AZ194]|uniref:acyl-CoA thioesterase n=1 Tax=Enterococcus sp. AZ194 TaxID=2774629 RepID=UPI003F25EA43